MVMANQIAEEMIKNAIHDSVMSMLPEIITIVILCAVLVFLIALAFNPRTS